MPETVYVDVESTGLDPARHKVWEAAVVAANGTSHSWVFPVTLEEADPAALRIGGFWERFEALRERQHGDRTSNTFALYKALDGKTLAGINPGFDERMLANLFRAAHLPPTPWHYKVVDVYQYALGVAHASGLVGLDEKISTDTLFAAFGVSVSENERHTAAGDAHATRLLHLSARNHAAEEN